MFSRTKPQRAPGRHRAGASLPAQQPQGPATQEQAQDTITDIERAGLAARRKRLVATGRLGAPRT